MASVSNSLGLYCSEFNDQGFTLTKKKKNALTPCIFQQPILFCRNLNFSNSNHSLPEPNSLQYNEVSVWQGKI